jgi:hypothetical protein
LKSFAVSCFDWPGFVAESSESIFVSQSENWILSRNGLCGSNVFDVLRGGAGMFYLKKKGEESLVFLMRISGCVLDVGSFG